MSRRKHKPKSPEQIALDKAKARAAAKAQDARGEYGIDLTTHTLPQNADIIAITDGAGKIQTARRDPMRDTLRFSAEDDTDEAKARASRLTIRREQALDRYEADSREAAGEGYKEGGGEFVDGASWRKTGPTDLRLLAAARLDIAKSLIGKRATAILDLVINPPSGETWRKGVERLTKETNAMAQSARVRAAVDDLIEVYEAMDHDGKVTHWRKMRCDA